MDAVLTEHVGYLQARLEDCEASPAVHRHQAAALGYLLARARAAGGMAAYMAETGDLFELVRAEQLDRWFNAAAVQRALGDGRKAAASEMMYLAGRAARARADFLARVHQAHERAPALAMAADAACGAIAPMISGLIDARSEAAPELREAAVDQVRSCWERLRASDPAACWARVLAHPPYRRRIPFAGAGLGVLRAGLAVILGDAALAGEHAPDPAGLDLDAAARDYAAHVGESIDPAPRCNDPDGPPLQELAAYRAAADAATAAGATEVRAVFDRVLALGAAAGSTQVFLRRMVEEHLGARLAASWLVAGSRAALAHARPLSQPHALFQHGTLIAALERARTPTEVEHVNEWATACYDVERDWNDLLLAAALCPLRAAADWALDPRPAGRQAVIDGARMSAALFGRPARDVLASPRVADFVDRALSPEAGAVTGAWLGEVGMGGVQSLRKLLAHRTVRWIEEALARGDHAAAGAGPPPPADGEMRTLIDDLLDRAGPFESPPAGAPGGIVYWDRPVDLHDLMGLLLAPPRPRPPL